MPDYSWRRKFAKRGDSMMIIIPTKVCTALGIEDGDYGIITTPNNHMEIKKEKKKGED